MIKTSMDYRRAVVRDRAFLADISMEFPGGKTEKITRERLMSDGLTIKDATSGSDSFDIGCAAIGECDIRIDNTDEKFNTYDFEGAELTVKVGLQLANGNVEWLPKGVYTAEPGKFTGSVITVTAYDNMRRFDRPYSDSKLSYPATLGAILADACSVCGVTLASADIPNRNYKVQERPTDEALTFREVLLWIGQICCRYWRCDAYGRLVSGWYDSNAFKSRQGLDGGIFDAGEPQYQSGDIAEGGSFHPWTNESNVDGGSFEGLQEYHHIYALQNISVTTVDVVITGVRVTEAQDSSVQDEPASYLVGTEGYILAVQENGFIRKGNGKSVAEYLGNCLIGMTFRPISVSCQSDPAMEAGDPAIVTDYKQNNYRCYITDMTYQLGGYQSVACNAKTPARNSAARFTEATQAFVKAKKNAKVQINEYDKAVQALTSLITQSFGVYKTEEKLEDGSTFFYMHNKPTLAESDTIWKMTADAFAVSTDGGKTWNAGMDSNGNVVVNVLSAVGIRFDWARGGTLTLGGENNVSGVMEILDAEGNRIGYWDKDGAVMENAIVKGRVITKNNNSKMYMETSYGELKLISEWSGSEENVFRLMASVILENNIPRYSPTFMLGGKAKSIGFSFSGSSRWALGASGVGDSATSIPGGKTGRAEFSDGSYLEFKNGFLTGGKTASGTTI